MVLSGGLTRLTVVAMKRLRMRYLQVIIKGKKKAFKKEKEVSASTIDR